MTPKRGRPQEITNLTDKINRNKQTNIAKQYEEWMKQRVDSFEKPIRLTNPYLI